MDTHTDRQRSIVHVLQTAQTGNQRETLEERQRENSQ